MEDKYLIILVKLVESNYTLYYINICYLFALFKYPSINQYYCNLYILINLLMYSISIQPIINYYYSLSINQLEIIL